MNTEKISQRLGSHPSDKHGCYNHPSYVLFFQIINYLKKMQLKKLVRANFENMFRVETSKTTIERKIFFPKIQKETII